MMGGDIFVDSKENIGSTFTVHILAEVEQAVEEATPMDPTPQAESTGTLLEGDSILVIDDDPNVRELISRILKREGYPVHTASDGVQGLQTARTYKPIAIILDVMMPSMDGWTVLATLKGDPELSQIPVIMHTMIEEKDMGFSLGAYDYMVKPINRNQLLSTLTKLRFNLQGSSVLVVEDDDATREMISRTLKKEAGPSMKRETAEPPSMPWRAKAPTSSCWTS